MNEKTPTAIRCLMTNESVKKRRLIFSSVLRTKSGKRIKTIEKSKVITPIPPNAKDNSIIIEYYTNNIKMGLKKYKDGSCFLLIIFQNYKMNIFLYFYFQLFRQQVKYNHFTADEWLVI